MLEHVGRVVSAVGPAGADLEVVRRHRGFEVVYFHRVDDRYRIEGPGAFVRALGQRTERFE